jgi:hypothetical protein
MRERAWESQSVMTVIGPRNNILRFLGTRASRRIHSQEVYYKASGTSIEKSLG